MERAEMAKLWSDMAGEGNWVPSWPASLAGLDVDEAAVPPVVGCHSIWQETAHVIFWRRATLTQMAGGAAPSDEENAGSQFAMPENATKALWAATLADLSQTHDAIAAAIENEAMDVSRVPFHLIHDAYHLGRITQVRAMLGTEPPF